MSSDASEEVAPSNEQMTDKKVAEQSQNDRFMESVRLLVPYIAYGAGALSLICLLYASHSFPAEFAVKSMDRIAEAHNISIQCSKLGQIAEDRNSNFTRCSAFMDNILRKEIDYKQKMLNVKKSGKWISLVYLHRSFAADFRIARCTTSMQIPEHQRENFITHKLEEPKWSCPAATEHCCDSGCCKNEFALRVHRSRRTFINLCYFFDFITFYAFIFMFVLKSHDMTKYEMKMDCDYGEIGRNWKKLDEIGKNWKKLGEQEDCDLSFDSMEDWDDEAMHAIEEIDRFDECDSGDE